MPEEALESPDPGAQAGAPESPGASPEGSSGETIELGSEWVEKPEGPGACLGGEGSAPEGLDEDMLRALVHSTFNIPAAIWGPHLARTEAQIEPVVQPLQAVIKKYNIDLMDYLPEAMLVLGTIGVCSGIYMDHQKYLAAKGKDEDSSPEETPEKTEPTPARKTRAADKDKTGFFDRKPGGPP